MKLTAISKKAISGLMAVMMIASVSVVSAFALDPGTYPTDLKADVEKPPHVLDFLGNATVSGDTITISVQAPATVSVYGQTVAGYITDIYTDSGYDIGLSGYTDANIGGAFIVTGLEIDDADVSANDPFEVHLFFDVVDLYGNPIHSGMGATLTVGSISN